MIISFTKMQSCGNDYIYIDARNLDLGNERKLAKSLAIRRLSVGSDGLILIKNSSVADFKMQIYNADGSEGKMCGNGIRCVGKFVYDKKLTEKKNIMIETLSGIKKVKLYLRGKEVKSASVEIGKCEPIGRLFAQNIDILGNEYKIYLVSVGNPHAVLLSNKCVNDINLEAVAKFVNKEIYHGINVEVINKLSANQLKMRVYERGSGETLACGPGASACVGALTMAGMLEAGKKITVCLKGGRLSVTCGANYTLTLFGNVKTVYEGEVVLIN